MTDVRFAVTPEVATKRSTGSLLAFLGLTFLVTWTFFVAAVRRSSSVGLGPGVGLLVLLGTIAPSLVALGLTAVTEGAAGVRTLLGRIARWRVGAGWYVFAVSYMVAIKLTVALLHRFVTGAWPRFGNDAWYVMVAALLVSTWVQAGEEVGWRGYALPRLAARLGLGMASVVLGVIWAVWHLPLFYLHGADTFGQSFPTYLASVIGLSVAMAWLYWNTRGSLLLVMLMHAAINNTKDIVPTVPRAPGNPLVPTASLMSWLVVAVVWTVGAYFLVRMRQADAARLTSPDPS